MVLCHGLLLNICYFLCVEPATIIIPTADTVYLASQANFTGYIVAVSILSVLLAIAAAIILFLYCSGKRNRKEAESGEKVEMQSSPVYQYTSSFVTKTADLPKEPNVAVYASISECA
eukprot:m.122003 g.122003  ORF g.122003 m.122003 type:complete len:117 (+) comp37762_c0_seq4:21-371(+)